MGCRDVARGPSALEHPLVSRQVQEGFLPPRSIRPGAFGHSQTPLRWLQVEGGKGMGSVSVSTEAWPACGTRRQVLLPCSANSWLPDLGSRRNFPQGQIGTGLRGFFAFLCSIDHGLLSELLWSILAGLLPAAPAPWRWPLVLCSWGKEGFFFLQGGLASVPGGFLPSSAALSTVPCQGSFGPFWPGARCSCSTKVALAPCIQGEKNFLDSRGLLLLLWARPLARAPLGPFGSVRACGSCTTKAPLVPWLSWALLPIASL